MEQWLRGMIPVAFILSGIGTSAILSPSSLKSNMVFFEIATLAISKEIKLSRVVLLDIQVVDVDLRKNVFVCQWNVS
jgi:hypothetical protein